MSEPLRVLSFESRKAKEISSLIERSGGSATIAPAMREIPLGMTDVIRTFHSHLMDGRYGLVIFLTGVGAEALLSAIETEHEREQFFEAMEHPRVVVRGPKPFSALRSWGVRIDAKAPEPNTWVEVIESVKSIYDESPPPLAGITVAVQEYGKPSTELYAGLEQLGASVEPVPVYRWDLPDDTGPIESAIRATIHGGFDVILFTTAQHIVHELVERSAPPLRPPRRAAGSRTGGPAPPRRRANAASQPHALQRRRSGTVGRQGRRSSREA